MSQQGPRLACGQIVGDRERQEDEYGVHDFGADHSGRDRLLVVVADGMGGYAGGREAAHAAVGRFLSAFDGATGSTSDRLRSALDAANRELADLKAANSALEDAGCTLVAAYIENGTVTWISVGDSSLLLLRGGAVRRLNQDHSMRSVLAELVRVGRMTPEEARANPNRNALRSALAGDDISLIDQPREPLALQAGDHIVLASDGLETLTHDAIASVLKKAATAPASKVLDALFESVTKAKARHQDNTTVVLYRAQGKARRRLWPKLAALAAAVVLVGVAALLVWGWRHKPAPPVHRFAPSSAAAQKARSMPASPTQQPAVPVKPRKKKE